MVEIWEGFEEFLNNLILLSFVLVYFGTSLSQTLQHEMDLLISL